MNKLANFKEGFIDTMKDKRFWIRAALSFMVLGILVAVIYAIVYMCGHSYADKSVPMGASGVPEKSSGITAWSDLPKGWLAVFGVGIAFAAIMIVVVGGWLRGSKWINKANPYIKGKEYIRTKNQKIVFRVIVTIMGLLLLGSFTLEMAHDTIFNTNSRNSLKNIFTSYLWSPINWYYQCFLTSLFMGFVILTRKYHLLPVLFPIAFLGSIRTLIDVKNDWGEKAYWSSVSFHRFMMLHIMILVAPLFIMFANREMYTLKRIKQSIIYTFFMVFAAYALGAFAGVHNSNGDTTVAKPTDYGEFDGAALLVGKSEDWIQAHFHIAFWFIIVPFGIAIIIGFAFLINGLQYLALAEGPWYMKPVNMWKDWWNDIKGPQWTELKGSFRFSQRLVNLFKDEKIKLPKVKTTQFGNKTK